MDELIKKIEQWGKDKGILDKATLRTQFQKLDEEVNEIHESIYSATKTKDDLKDGIGDAFVVLVLMAKLAGMTIEECAEYAYDEIKGRKGEMKNGVFVKDSGNVKLSEPDQK